MSLFDCVFKKVISLKLLSFIVVSPTTFALRGTDYYVYFTVFCKSRNLKFYRVTGGKFVELQSRYDAAMTWAKPLYQNTISLSPITVYLNVGDKEEQFELD